jgi:hypothetical protein
VSFCIRMEELYRWHGYLATALLPSFVPARRAPQVGLQSGACKASSHISERLPNQHFRNQPNALFVVLMAEFVCIDKVVGRLWVRKNATSVHHDSMQVSTGVIYGALWH